MQNTEILIAMQKDLGKKLKGLRVDGGASQNNLLMQMQADFMGSAVVRPRLVETTSMGAAYLAGLGVGFWNSLEDIKRVWKVDREFDPHLSAKQRTDRLARWKKAVVKTR